MISTARTNVISTTEVTANLTADMASYFTGRVVTSDLNLSVVAVMQIVTGVIWDGATVAMVTALATIISVVYVIFGVLSCLFFLFSRIPIR